MADNNTTTTTTTTQNPPPPSEEEESEELDLLHPPFPLTSTDLAILNTPDATFPRATWSDLHTIIHSNRLEDLKRTPADLKRYLLWSRRVKDSYGSITAFVLKERLHWTPVSETGPPVFECRSRVPFGDARDFAVLVNDWPYGVEDGISHLIVWTKTPVEVDETRGDLTDSSRRRIEEFVEGFFVEGLVGTGMGRGEAREKVMWFKNWVGLQSVRGLDHVHVLVKDVPVGLLEEWTRRRDLEGEG